MRKIAFLLLVFVCLAAGAAAQAVTEGSLFASDRNGKELGACPLKTTSVKADISGFLARVNVRQEFENKFNTPIEAVYVFPLSQKGAVDQMTMTVGSRVTRGRIMRREEARQTYETARSEGKAAALLDQERPNIFTQSVANIMPGESIVIEISYVETLKYEDGSYEFVFPMTVGPRYIPGGVADAAKIKPPVAAVRNGSDISVEVNVNAGVPVEEVRSSSHLIEQVNRTPSEARVTLRGGRTIPNKDFVLRYDVTGRRIEDAFLTHRDPRGGFFTMILQPPDKIGSEDRTPKEIVFVLDTSGSMSGFPIEKAKEAMRLSLDGLYPEDTFNLITFAGETEILFERPVPATQANLEKAQAFLAGRSGGGGTEMMKAIRAALDPTDSQEHLRIVCFMTDGYVGNENEIIAEVQRHPNARVFSFGIGSSVNRFLLDKIASEGKGEAEYVALEDDGSKAARKFYERVRSPLLTDLSVDWNGLPVADVYPGKLTDLFSAKPVILHGRYTAAASGTIKLRGKVAGQPYERAINVNLPADNAANDVLATLWARTRVDELSAARLNPASAEAGTALDKQITDLALEFGLMTNFTSFVAVDDRVVNPNGTPTTVEVPVEKPAGTNGGDNVYRKLEVLAALQRPPAVTFSGGANNQKASVALVTKSRSKSISGSGQGSGRGSGVGNGTGSGSGSGSGGGAGGITNTVTVSGTSAAVDVTSGDAVSTNSSGAQIQTNITAQTIQQLPINGRSFSSLLKISPGFMVDGSSGSENVFVIDGQEVTNFRTSAGASGSSGEPFSFTGTTLVAVEPEYPASARRLRSGREVSVDIEVDVLGNMASAKATSGNPALRKASVFAATSTKFQPVLVDGKPVRLKGTLVYKFTSAKKVAVVVRSMKALPPTAADERQMRLDRKLHFWVSAAVARYNSGAAIRSENEGKFVNKDVASLQLKLSATSPGVLANVRAAGFEILGQTNNVVFGRAKLSAISTIAELADVELILPKL